MLGISPDFDRHWLKPGSGNVVQLNYGLLPDNELAAISNLWDRTLLGLTLIDSVDWKHVVGAVSDWMYPRTRSGPSNPSENTTKLMQATGLRMLHDLEQYSENNPALAQWLMEESGRFDAALERYVDTDFETLYPSRYFAQDFEEIGRQRRNRAICLAGEFARRDPDQAAETLARLDHSNRQLDTGRGQTLSAFGQALAGAVTPLSDWIDALFTAGAPPAVLDAFIARSRETDTELWESTVDRCIGNQQYHRLGLWSVLTHPAPPKALIMDVCTDPELLHLNLSFVTASDVSHEVIGHLLENAPDQIASKAVVGLWWKDPRGEIPDDLRPSWERALFRYDGRDYDLADILKSDSRLGNAWLSTQLSAAGRFQDLWRLDKSLEAATRDLSTEQRRDLIGQLLNSLVVRDVAELIVGDDTEAFSTLLEDSRLSAIHLTPLGTWSNKWLDKARVAFSAGRSIEDIVVALLYPSLKVRAFSGPESNIWREWIERSDELASTDDMLAQQLAEFGRRIASSEFDRALGEERNEAVYGWN